jgi:hypothetical protein
MKGIIVMKVSRKLGVTLALILAISVALGLGACSNSSDKNVKPSGDASNPYQILAAENEKLNTADGISMNLDLGMQFSSGGTDMEMQTTGDAKINKVDKEMEMNQKISLQGQENAIHIWYKDGYMYADAGSAGKGKQVMQFEDAFSQAGTLVNFPESAIKDQSSKEVADGTELTFNVGGSALKDYAANALSQLGSDGSNVDFADATIVVLISKDGSISAENFTMAFTIEAAGEELTANMTVNYTDIKFGAVKIEFPADLDSYIEM